MKKKGGIAQHSNQFDQTENGDYVAKLMKFLNSSSSFNVYNFKQLLSDIQLESVSTQSSKKQNINVQKQSSNISSQTQKAEPIVNRTDVNSVQQPKVNSIQKEPVVRQNIPDNRISVPPVQPPVSAMNVPQGATNVGKKGKDETPAIAKITHILPPFYYSLLLADQYSI